MISVRTAPTTVCKLVIMSVATVLLFTLRFSLLRTHLHLVHTALTSYLDQFPLRHLPLVHRHLLHLNTRHQLLRNFHHLTNTSLKILHKLTHLKQVIARRHRLHPFTYGRSRSLLVKQFYTRSSTNSTMPTILSVLHRPSPRLTIIVCNRNKQRTSLRN